jgi:hypothetical protein
MIISKTLKYVYIAIPRTGSKSMSQWLVDHYQGEWTGRHHEWKVPDDCRGFLVFTLIRNPYEIQASGWFFEPVIKSGREPPRPQTYAQAVAQWVRPTDQPISQKEFVEWSGISQILYFEHLPGCLQDLPFVDPDNVAPFPHLNAGGYRPSGDFFGIMAKGDEELVWENSRDDFEFFGYERYNAGPPTAPNKRLQRTR